MFVRSLWGIKLKHLFAICGRLGFEQILAKAVSSAVETLPQIKGGLKRGSSVSVGSLVFTTHLASGVSWV